MERKLNPLYQKLLRELDPKPDPVRPVGKQPTAIDGELKKFPLIELIDMRTDLVWPNGIEPDEGGGVYTLKEPFMRIARLVVLMTWAGTTLNYNLFGTGALVTGCQIYINNKPLFPLRIQSLKDYMRYAYDTDVVVDTAGATKRVYFTSRFSLTKFMGGDEGIDASEYDIEIFGDEGSDGNVGIDDVTDVASWAFEGWGWDR